MRPAAIQVDGTRPEGMLEIVRSLERGVELARACGESAIAVAYLKAKNLELRLALERLRVARARAVLITD